MRMSWVAFATTSAMMLAMTAATGQPMPPSQPAVPQTVPPDQMPPEKIAPNALPNSKRELGQAPSGQPRTPNQPASPTKPVVPVQPDSRETSPAGSSH